MADLLCISTSAYCKIEYCETDLTLTRIRRLAEIFNMSEQDLAMRLLSSSDSVLDTGAAKSQNNTLMIPSSLENLFADMITQNHEYRDMIAKHIARIDQSLEGFHMKD